MASGMGKAGQIAMNIATTFASTGIPAVSLHPSEAQHGDLGILQPDDVMLLISNSGKTREIVELVELTRGLYPQIPFIVITGNAESPLAALADVTLFTGGAPEVCPLGLTPTTSTTMMTVIGDVLVVKSIDRLGRNYTEILEQWACLTKEKGVAVVVLDMPLLDTRQGRDLTGTLIADIVLQLLSYVAQTERECLRQRQAEGIAAAKSKGKHLGRPKAELPDNWNEVITAWKAGEITAVEAMRQTGLKRSTFYKMAG